MSKKKEINVKLFKKIIQHVEKDLRRLEMSLYGIREGTEGAGDAIVGGDVTNPHWPACGTKACCAGWAVLLSTPKKNWKKLFKANGEMLSNTHRKAAELLGLGENDSYRIFQGNAVCMPTGKQQLEALREDINKVFEENGIEDRV